MVINSYFSYITFNSVTTIRGDLVMIRIGQYVILEPNCIIRPCFKKIKGKYGSVPISIGDCVQIGENSVVMASSIGSNVYIGKNSIIGSGSIIKDNCVILPNTTIAPNTLIPPFTEWGGTPGVMLRRLPESQNILLQQSAIEYYNNFQLVSSKVQEEPEKIQHSNTTLINSMKTGISNYVKDKEEEEGKDDNEGGRVGEGQEGKVINSIINPSTKTVDDSVISDTKDNNNIMDSESNP
ncbi:dynactin subunit p25-like [Cryptosporidium sp. chipmunk genotype I]|uniref:dynactin subunit p25-like n=1 Tax=Cryptosporidium sp. chipmunk genotype I TaxID=1280935 RepID=UPI00351A356A|nr:dynactin subunit p25-like [Cryptosporidium sp. chipmunk genotype I]